MLVRQKRILEKLARFRRGPDGVQVSEDETMLKMEYIPGSDLNELGRLHHEKKITDQQFQQAQQQLDDLKEELKQRHSRLDEAFLDTKNQNFIYFGGHWYFVDP